MKALNSIDYLLASTSVELIQASRAVKLALLMLYRLLRGRIELMVWCNTSSTFAPLHRISLFRITHSLAPEITYRFEEPYIIHGYENHVNGSKTK